MPAGKCCNRWPRYPPGRRRLRQASKARCISSAIRWAACWRGSIWHASAAAARPCRHAGHTQRRQRVRRPPQAPLRLSRLFRSGRTAARHQPDAAISEMLPAVDYPVGVIAGNQSVYLLASAVLPKPNDGRVSVENTRLDGMADHIMIAVASLAAGQWTAIEQTIAFLRDGKFERRTELSSSRRTLSRRGVEDRHTAPR